MNKPYVTAAQAAALLGVSVETVTADIGVGMRGELLSLIGGKDGDYWFVESFELQGERLESHRKRLTDPLIPDQVLP